MTIVEALKTKKRLNKKLEDIRKKISEYSAHLDNEKPVYGDAQKARVQGWVQSHRDMVKKIEDLSIAIQKTNLQTEVEINLGGTPIKKSIAQWILRRTQLAAHEEAAFKALHDRNLRDTVVTASDGKTKQTVSVIRYFDPVERDRMVDTFRHEPSMIDQKLEVVNATTQLVENVEVNEAE
jgi:hypothetical protein